MPVSLLDSGNLQDLIWINIDMSENDFVSHTAFMMLERISPVHPDNSIHTDGITVLCPQEGIIPFQDYMLGLKKQRLTYSDLVTMLGNPIVKWHEANNSRILYVFAPLLNTDNSGMYIRPDAYRFLYFTFSENQSIQDVHVIKSNQAPLPIRSIR